MCLISDDIRERVAERDIPCVKVLVRRDGGVYTPYFSERVCRIVLCGIFPMRAKGDENVVHGTYSGSAYVTVTGGFVHVYASRADYIHWEWLWHDGGMIEFYDCVIPKGTRYWMSNDGSQYAAKKIRFVRKTK